MSITITLDVPDDLADSGHETGLTEQGYLALTSGLADLGFEIAAGPVQA